MTANPDEILTGRTLLRLLVFQVFFLSWCFTPHFNPRDLRFICGSPIQ
jgi:hypothetical protein